MGGKALGYEARRIDTQELNQIATHLADLFYQFDPRLVQSYSEKVDHGDIDMVLMGDYGDVRDAVDYALDTPTQYDNKPVLSFDYTGVQIDFTVCSTPQLQLAQLQYFAWNDLGNFIGRVARSMNFKYGHEGLKYIVRLSEHAVIELHISSDMPKVLEFLGYDVNRWYAGFKTKEEIFEYAASTPYFNSLYFSLEFQAHQDRVRNKKRKMYNSMLQYISDNYIEEKPKLTQEERDVHLERAAQFFGVDVVEEIKELKDKYARKEQLKTKFNGELVREWSGLNGPELGKAIIEFKRSVVKLGGTFEDFVEQTSPGDIEAFFRVWLNTSRSTP